MASDLSSSENIMDDEKEEGELSLEDVSSSEEGAVYSKYLPRKLGQCRYCLSTNLCATWCRSLTVNKKNNQRDAGLQGKENRANQRRFKDAPEVQQSQKKKKDPIIGQIEDLTPISSDSDMEIVGLDENVYIKRKTKSSKIKRKHRNKSPSMLLSPVSQDIAMSIKKSIHKLNSLEHLDLSKKESTSGHSKHYHHSQVSKTKLKSLPVLKKHSRSPPVTRSRTKKRPSVESPLRVASPSSKKHSLETKVTTKTDSLDSPETPSSQEKVTKLLKKVRELEPYSTRISEKRSLKDKLSGIIKNKEVPTESVAEEISTKEVDNETTAVKADAVEVEIISKKTTDAPSVESQEVEKKKTPIANDKTKEREEAKILPEVTSDAKTENDPAPKSKEAKNKTAQKPSESSLPSVASASRPSSPLPSSPLSISPTPPETEETVKLPNFCMDDNDEDLELRLIALRSAVIKKHQTRLKSGSIKKKLRHRRVTQRESPIPRLESPFQSEFQKEFPTLAKMCMSPDSSSELKDDIYCPEDMELDSDMELDDRDSPYSPTDDVGEITLDKDESPPKLNQSLYSPSAPTETPQFKYYRGRSKETGLEGSFLELRTQETRPYSPTDVPYFDPELPGRSKPSTESFVPTMQHMSMYPPQQFMLGCPTNPINPYMDPMPVLPPPTSMTSLPVNPMYPSLIPSYPMMPMATSNSIPATQSVAVDLSVPYQQPEPIKQVVNNELNIEETDLDGSPLVPEDYKSVPWPPVRGEPVYYENILDNLKLNSLSHHSRPEFGEIPTPEMLQSRESLFRHPSMNPVVAGNNVVYGGRFRPTKVKPIVERVLTTQAAAAFSASNSDFDDLEENEMIMDHRYLEQIPMQFSTDTESPLITITGKKKKKKKKGKPKISLPQLSVKTSLDDNTNKEDESKDKSMDDDEETLRKQLLDSLAKKVKSQSLMKNVLPQKTVISRIGENKEISKTLRPINQDPANTQVGKLVIKKYGQQQSAPISSTSKVIKKPTNVLEQSVEKTIKRSKINSADVTNNQELQPGQKNVSENANIKVNNSAEIEARSESPETTESQRIVINLNEETRDDTGTTEASKSEKEKPEIPSYEFEKSVDQFLKNLRQQQEKSSASPSENSQDSFNENDGDAHAETTIARDCSSPEENVTTVKITYNDIKTVSTSTVTAPTAVGTTTTATTATVTSSISTTTKPKAAFTVTLGPPVAETGARNRSVPSAATVEKPKVVVSAPRVVKPGTTSKPAVQRPTNCPTPQVVKHLPASQREEYLRLKLKILEREKQLQKAKESKSNATVTASSATEKTSKTKLVESANPILKPGVINAVSDSTKTIKIAPTTSEVNTEETSNDNISIKNSVPISQKDKIKVEEVDEQIISREEPSSNLLIPKTEKQDSSATLINFTQNSTKEPECNETSHSCKSKHSWEDFKVSVNSEVQTLTDLTPDDQKKLLSETEEKLVTKRHAVLDDITEMSTNLRQWEVERDLQNIISIEIKNLREQLRIAEEKFQQQKEKMNVIQPKVSMYHGKINEGRKECFRLSKICHGLGTKIIGPNYKAPTAAAELLNNRIKEVANHTQKLRSKKTTVKKPIENINLKKKNDSSKIKRVLKKVENNGVKLIDKNLSAIKETAVVNEKHKTDKVIPKNITILSPHTINLKAERQLNNLIRKNGETKESLISKVILPNAETSSKEFKQFFNRTPSLNNINSVNIINKQTEPTNVKNVFKTNHKIISSEKNENNINDGKLNINFELNLGNNDKVCKEKSNFEPMSTQETEMHCTVQTEAHNSIVILENNSDNSKKNLVSSNDNICDSNFQETNIISISSESSTVETQSKVASNDFVVTPVFTGKTKELENIKELTETNHIKSTLDKIENENHVDNSNSDSIMIISDVSMENFESSNEKKRNYLKELPTQYDKTDKSKLINQNVNDVSVEVTETVHNSSIKNIESATELSNVKKTNSITSLSIEIIENPEIEKQSSVLHIATPMEIDIETETSLPINEVSNVENCQIENEISAGVEVQSNELAAIKPTIVESTPTESSHEKNSRRILQSINSNFITSTPNKINDSERNEDFSEPDLVIDVQMNRENVNQQVSPTQINLEENFIEINDEEVISKPARTMLGIKEDILHAGNILSQMLKLSKKPVNNNENCVIPSTSNDKNSKQLNTNEIFKNIDDSKKSNNNENPTLEVQKISSQNLDRGSNPKNIETNKEIESNEKFENDCFEIEISRDSEHSTLLEEIALLEQANSQEVPNKISYKPKKVLANTEKYPNSSSEDVVKINFPRQNSKKKIASQSHDHILKHAPSSVSHIKINLPDETGQSFKSVWNSQSRSVSNLTRETARPPLKTVQSLKPAQTSEVFQSYGGPIRRRNKGTRSNKKSESNSTLSRVKKFDRPYESVLRHLNTPRYSKPNGVLCPFQLRGTCNDEDCQFVHQSSQC